MRGLGVQQGGRAAAAGARGTPVAVVLQGVSLPWWPACEDRAAWWLRGSGRPWRAPSLAKGEAALVIAQEAWLRSRPTPGMDSAGLGVLRGLAG